MNFLHLSVGVHCVQGRFLAGQDIEKRGSQYAGATTAFVNSKAGSEETILEPRYCTMFLPNCQAAKGWKSVGCPRPGLDQSSRTLWWIAISVADPGCLSLIPIFIHLGSRISDPRIPDSKTATKEEGKKISRPTTNITKFKIILVLNR
jgi:hypothetical protein